jgi:hypothetical protein
VGHGRVCRDCVYLGTPPLSKISVQPASRIPSDLGNGTVVGITPKQSPDGFCLREEMAVQDSRHWCVGVFTNNCGVNAEFRRTSSFT